MSHVIDADVRTGLRAQLEAERDHLLAQAGVDPSDLADPEDPTLGHDAVTTALETMTRTALDRVTSALTRLDDGSYGACLDCASAIPVERLEIMPAAAYCVACQQRNE